MNRLNLSAWALRHPQMVLYLIVVLMLGGAFSLPSSAAPKTLTTR
jgi:multidrug efflux pump subunit AcrB